MLLLLPPLRCAVLSAVGCAAASLLLPPLRCAVLSAVGCTAALLPDDDAEQVAVELSKWPGLKPSQAETFLRKMAPTAPNAAFSRQGFDLLIQRLQSAACVDPFPI